MAEFQVRSAQVRTSANELEKTNSDFQAKVTSMEEQEVSLGKSWEGEAKTTFHSDFAQKVAKWREFAAEIDKYVTTLRQIADEYDKAEQQNAQIASGN